MHSADLEDVWVSKFSRWNDEFWQFEIVTAGTARAQYRMSWNFKIGLDGRFTDAQYATLLESWKRAIWCLFAEPGDGKYRKFNNCGNLTTTLKFLVEWMVAQGYRDLSMLQPAAADRFIDHLETNKAPSDEAYLEWDDQDQLEEKSHITASALSRYLQIWLAAYWARDVLKVVGLPAFPDSHPFRGRNALEVALGVTRRWPGRTIEIPDELFVPVMNASFELIQAPWVSSFIALSNWLAEHRPPKDLSDKVRRTLDRDACEARLKWLGILEPNETGIEAFRRILTRLESSCVAIIQGLTGIRISEICGLAIPLAKKKRGDDLPGIIEIEPSFDDEYEIFYLRGFVYKHRSSPEPTRWVLGMRPAGSQSLPPPVQAITILQGLYDGWRRFGNIDRLIVSVATPQAIPYQPDHIQRPLSSRLRVYQREYCRSLLCLESTAAWEFGTHSWRKTFARYMIRTNRNLLPALSHHLKHMSTAMTEVAYCQGDVRAAELLQEARVSEAGDMICGVITGEQKVFGPVASEIEELSERLRARFANRSSTDRIDDVRAAVRERDIQLYDSGFGWCVFRGDGARCHELKDNAEMIFMRFAPSFENVTPAICHRCKNFGVSPNHESFWKERLAQAETLLKKQKADPSCTIRHVVRRRAEQCKTVIDWIQRGGDPRAAKG